MQSGVDMASWSSSFIKSISEEESSVDDDGRGGGGSARRPHIDGQRALQR